MIEYLLWINFRNFVFRVGTEKQRRVGVGQGQRGRTAARMAGADEARHGWDQAFVGVRPELLFET
jgi:hypothetical protein